ncbi:MAG: purine-binding chemotaxis protein CheW [Firmicutes bacterium]|nr:purine-binding chemotaxis protein CheW [Bacillota bacterium]
MEETAAAVNQEIQLVAFNLGAEEYAIDILSVQEINRVLPITRIPNAPHYVVGVINLRGNVIPVIDLHQRLNIQTQENTEQTRIIILKVGEMVAGIIVDGVTEVLKLEGEQIEEASNIATSVDNEFLLGVGKLEERLIILLNLEKVLEV